MNEKSNGMADFRKQLLSCFNNSLPGTDAHLSIAPIHRRHDIVNEDLKINAVKSSVLLLFYEKQNEPHLVFIRRPKYNGVHSGQISFPGGRWEKTDKSMYHTALRESGEEIGIQPNLVKYTGKLSDLYIPPSNYIVSPFVGIYAVKPKFNLDPQEVDDIVEVPFSFFLDSDALTKVNITVRDSETFSTHAFVYHDNIIWGATAMILNELIVLWKTTVE